MLTSNIKQFLLLFLATLTIVACSKKEEPAQEEIADAPEVQSEASAEDKMPAIKNVLVISHDIKDYDVWKAGYDKGYDIRKEAGLLEFGVYKANARDNFYCVALGVTNVEAAEGFVSSEGLKTAMQDAGVVDKSVIKLWYSPLWEIDRALAKEKSTGKWLNIEHEVEDYATWKAEFDKHADFQAEYRVTPFYITHKRDNKNIISVMAAVESFEEAEKFVNSANLKAAMKVAGVIGKPDIVMSTSMK